MPTVAKAIRFTEDERDIIEHYAEINRRNFSDVVRDAVLRKIEDEYDLQLLLQAIKDDDGYRISHDDLMKKYGYR